MDPFSKTVFTYTRIHSVLVCLHVVPPREFTGKIKQC